MNFHPVPGSGEYRFQSQGTMIYADYDFLVHHYRSQQALCLTYMLQGHTKPRGGVKRSLASRKESSRNLEGNPEGQMIES